jgi:hypothetical protein
MVFRMLRNKEELSALKLQGLPAEINKNNYISYAPCSVTEGPFVFRKNLSVSYYDELRRITAKEQLHELNDNIISWITTTMIFRPATNWDRF